MKVLQEQSTKLVSTKDQFSLEASVKNTIEIIRIINLLEQGGKSIKGEPIIEGMGLKYLHPLALEFKTASGKSLIDYL